MVTPQYPIKAVRSLSAPGVAPSISALFVTEVRISSSGTSSGIHNTEKMEPRLSAFAIIAEVSVVTDARPAEPKNIAAIKYGKLTIDMFIIKR